MDAQEMHTLAFGFQRRLCRMARFERFVGGFDGGPVVVHCGNHGFFWYLYILPEFLEKAQILQEICCFVSGLCLLLLNHLCQLSLSPIVGCGVFFRLQQSEQILILSHNLIARPQAVTLSS